ncbi:anti-sigma factor domain-containing protein [Cytobacillus sp. FJAT-54145]|uniref:Anti-sigma factor domain-containing protein n=1 Tax=Cytobacillus spartinae TaxID=3299023 RepID=A0ABW6KLK3_9BACI
MKKGIIMEVNEQFLTMLTPDGEFLRARNTNVGYAIGQEINFFPIEVEDRKKIGIFNFFQTFRGKSIVAVSLACMLLIFSFIPFYNSNEVYAYMSIDINPSLELAVNEDLQVLELIPYNDSAENIISEIKDWEKQNISAVTELILTKVKEKGFLKEQNSVVIGTVYIGERVEEIDQRLTKTVNTLKQEIKEEKEKVIIKAIEATKEERTEAKENGVTVGKFKASKKENGNSISNENKPNESKPNKNKPKENKPNNPSDNKMNGKANGQNANKDKKVNENKGLTKKEEKEQQNQNNKSVPPGQEKKDQGNGNSKKAKEQQEEKKNNKGKDKEQENKRANKEKEKNNESKGKKQNNNPEEKSGE